MELSEVSPHSEVALLLRDETGPLNLVEIRRKAGLQLEQFSRLVRKQLADRYIDVPPALCLVDCPNCSLTLGCPHPQADEIVDWLDGNLSVHQAFKEVELMYEMVFRLENKNAAPVETWCFHVGLTSLGNVAYFEEAQCCIAQ